MPDLLAALTAWLDNRKKVGGQNIQELINDPQALISRLGQQTGEDMTGYARRQMEQSQALRSVMPEVREQAGQEMMRDVPGAFGGITAWHGSPHLFDKFDMSKVGTGEGAQAYGHGLYAAEAPAVGQEYRDILARRSPPSGAPDKMSAGMDENAVVAMFQNRKAAKLSDEVAREQTLAWARNNPQIRTEVAEKLVPKLSTNEGHLYKVDIPDEHVAKMLDWDKPLREQPESVRKALEPLLAQVEASKWKIMSGFPQGGVEREMARWRSGLTGESIVSEIGAFSGKSDAEASAALLAAGIPGIRYLDAASRSAGKGTSNFVVFDDKLMKILERNGVVQDLKEAMKK